VGRNWEIRDPIHGYIKVNELERSLIDTSYFQRLKRVKQLGMVHVVYPGAEHSRFTHSLGTMHLAGEIGERLRNQGFIDEADAQDLRIAGLLHDLGHGPFSHAFEDLLHASRGMNHEDVTLWLVRESILRDVLESFGVDSDRVAELAVGRTGGAKAFLGDAIAGHFSADILDYLIRDAHFTGVEYGRIDVSRIIDSLSVVQGKLAADVNALYAIEAFVIARYEMFKAVYFHRTARAANIMISFEKAEDYLSLTDEYVINAVLLGEGRDEGVREAKGIIEAILARRLLKMTYERLFHTQDQFFSSFLHEDAFRSSLLDKIAEEAGVPREKLYFDFPSVLSLPNYPIRGDFPAFVTEDGGRSLVSVPSLSFLIGSLSGYTNIIRVYSTDDVREEVEEIARNILGEGVHYTHRISY
jgi:HD superfamily phosphohydrolase